MTTYAAASSRATSAGTAAALRGSRATEIRLTSRLVYLADVVAAFERLGGADAALRMARERAGGQFDPDLVDLLSAHGSEVLDGLDRRQPLGRGPRPRARAGPDHR